MHACMSVEPRYSCTIPREGLHHLSVDFIEFSQLPFQAASPDSALTGEIFPDDCDLVSSYRNGQGRNTRAGFFDLIGFLLRRRGRR